ncbi:type II toxin-antitoxin system HicA family toxin [Pirellulimonas nuda]|uniref:type II toxin-antitoxin system HicA family toxin n=1 Tax=Pirellulimonas nuda TaxID=2528009 RepID=UPI00119E11F0
MKYREAVRRLAILGCVETPRRGGGSHRKWRNPIAGRSAVLPDHGGKDLKVGTLRAAVRQLGLDWEAFEQA